MAIGWGRVVSAGLGLATLSGVATPLLEATAYSGFKPFGWTLAGGGLLLAATGLAGVSYRWLADKAALPTFTPDFECRPAKRHELEAIHEMALEQLGDGVSAVATMHRWFDKNRRVFYVLYENKKSERRETRTLRGYFCLIPITDEATSRMLAGEIRAVNLTPRDIVEDGKPCGSVFIGALVATTRMARANLISVVRYELVEHASKTTGTLLTRPVTDDGLRLVKDKRFSAVDPSRQGEMNVLYRYDIRGEQSG